MVGAPRRGVVAPPPPRYRAVGPCGGKCGCLAKALATLTADVHIGEQHGPCQLHQRASVARACSAALDLHVDQRATGSSPAASAAQSAHSAKFEPCVMAGTSWLALAAGSKPGCPRCFRRS